MKQIAENMQQLTSTVLDQQRQIAALEAKQGGSAEKAPHTPAAGQMSPAMKERIEQRKNGANFNQPGEMSEAMKDYIADRKAAAAKK